jgi:hypothetical protein
MKRIWLTFTVLFGLACFLPTPKIVPPAHGQVLFGVLGDTHYLTPTLVGTPPACGHSASSANLTYTTTGANFIAVAVGYYAAESGLSLSDSVSGNHNTWSHLTAQTGTTGNQGLSLYYTVPAYTGSDVITATASSNFDGSLCAAAFSGVGAFGNQNGSASSSETTAATGSIGTSIRNMVGDLVVTAIASGANSLNSSIATSSFTLVKQVAGSSGTYYGSGIGYELSPGGSVSATWQWNGTSQPGAVSIGNWAPQAGIK